MYVHLGLPSFGIGSFLSFNLGFGLFILLLLFFLSVFFFFGIYRSECNLGILDSLQEIVKTRNCRQGISYNQSSDTVGIHALAIHASCVFYLLFVFFIIIVSITFTITFNFISSHLISSHLLPFNYRGDSAILGLKQGLISSSPRTFTWTPLPLRLQHPLSPCHPHQSNMK